MAACLPQASGRIERIDFFATMMTLLKRQLLMTTLGLLECSISKGVYKDTPLLSCKMNQVHPPAKSRPYQGLATPKKNILEIQSTEQK